MQGEGTNLETNYRGVSFIKLAFCLKYDKKEKHTSSLTKIWNSFGAFQFSCEPRPRWALRKIVVCGSMLQFTFLLGYLSEFVFLLAFLHGYNEHERNRFGTWRLSWPGSSYRGPGARILLVYSLTFYYNQHSHDFRAQHGSGCSARVIMCDICLFNAQWFAVKSTILSCYFAPTDLIEKWICLFKFSVILFKKIQFNLTRFPKISRFANLN